MRGTMQYVVGMVSGKADFHSAQTKLSIALNDLGYKIGNFRPLGNAEEFVVDTPAR